MLQEGPGQFAGDQYDKEKVEQALKQLPKDLSTEEAYAKLIPLLAEDYGPVEKKIDAFDPKIQVNTSKPGGVEAPQATAVSAQSLKVEILLDASGSMRKKLNGKTKMEWAKESIEKFVASLPKETQVGLRVYGHKGGNQESQKEASCKSNELIYGMEVLQQDAFKQALAPVQPTGFTPLAAAIESAQADFVGGESKNVVYIVSDGEETCDGDPVAMAKALHESNIEAVVNIIGFNVDDAGQAELREVAASGGGEYIEANSEADLKKYFADEYIRLKKEWLEWRKKSEKSVDQQDTNNELGLHELIQEEAIGLVEAEYTHLKKAAQFLREAGIMKDDTGVYGKIADRKKKLKNYFIDRDNQIEEAISKEEKEKIKQIRETEQQKQDDLDKEIDGN
nr:VWA domain-containing protein [Polycladospora coralii]